MLVIGLFNFRSISARSAVANAVSCFGSADTVGMAFNRQSESNTAYGSQDLFTNWSLVALCQGISGFRPLLNAAVERNGTGKSHLAQRSGRKRTDFTNLTVHDDSLGGVWQLLINAKLELPARNNHRAGYMTRTIGLTLAHIEQGNARVVGGQAPVDFRQRHKRDIMGRFIDQLGNGFATT